MNVFDSRPLTTSRNYTIAAAILATPFRSRSKSIRKAVDIPTPPRDHRPQPRRLLRPSADALAVAARVQLTLWLDGQPYRRRGRVVTRHPQFGNGIMFMDYEDQAEVLLNRYIDSIVS